MSQPDLDRLWDVVIIGAGPAGAAAALSALRTRPDASVLLIDRSAFPRDKCCGDGIAPHALDELARLGAAHVLADRVPITQLHLQSPAGREVTAPLRRPDYVVPRTVFDARLVDAAVQRGAVLVRRTVRTLVQRADHVLVDGALRARVVVGADGANGVVRREIGLGRQPDTAMAIAVRGYARTPAGPPEQRIVMDSRDWPAYAWRFDAGDGTSNVGFGLLMPSLRKAPRSGRAELHGRLEELLPGLEPTRLISHKLPLSTSRPVQPAGRVLLVGDALSLVNPLTGEGIFYALLSGRLAGVAAVGRATGPLSVVGIGRSASAAEDPGRAYAAALGRELGRHLRHTTALTRLTQRPALVNAGVAGCGRSPAAFDALIEVGLGRGLITAPLVGAIAGHLGRRLLRRAA